MKTRLSPSSLTRAAARAILTVTVTMTMMTRVTSSSHHDSDPFPGVHTRVAGERPAFGASVCGDGGDHPGVTAHELWGDVIVAGNALKTQTSMACCRACQETDGCNVW